jgi:cytoplasmic tRNA 2-thiolation protein 2
MEKESINFEIRKNKIEIEDDEGELPCGGDTGFVETKPKGGLDRTICYKCKMNKSNYANRHEFICKQCFLGIISHKFRSNLRTHCKIRHEDNLLVCISGGVNSMAMLHWFYGTFNDNTSNRKQFFKLKVLYVDQSCLYYSGDALLKEREFKFNQISRICKSYGFPFDIINLEHILSTSQYNEESNNFRLSDDNHIKGLQKLYQAVSLIGAFDKDFVKILTRNLIFKYSTANGFNKVVFGNNGHGLVSNTFLNIIKGRGYSMKEDIEYVDSHYSQVKILRPMKDFLNKEVLLFFHINSVELICSTNIDGFEIKQNNSKLNIPFKGDTYALVSGFIDNLQNKMGSTITTVMGTTEKIKIKEKGKPCEFCLNYIDGVYNNLEIGSIDSAGNEQIFENEALCFGCKRMFQNFDTELLATIPKFL